MGNKTTKNKISNITEKITDEKYLVSQNITHELSKGKMIDFNNNVYIGEFKNNKFNGYGIMEYHNSNIIYYKGEWNNGFKHGYGVEEYKDGCKYIGIFEFNSKHGYGKLIFSNGYYYIGDFFNDKITGKGSLYGPKNSLIYNGYWFNNLFHGYGKYYIKNNLKYEGNFNNGFIHGIGTLNFDNSNKNFKGIFEFNFIKEIIYYFHTLTPTINIFDIEVYNIKDFHYHNLLPE